MMSNEQIDSFPVVAPLEKRGRGRPRKHALPTEATVKRGRGRPRKYSIIEKETTKNGVLKAVFKKVDSGHLIKHFLNYFTKLLILHHELSKDMGKQGPIFTRLKNLDFQMVEVCKNLLTSEYKTEINSGAEEGVKEEQKTEDCLAVEENEHEEESDLEENEEDTGEEESE